jgi:hypothetical protein
MQDLALQGADGEDLVVLEEAVKGVRVFAGVNLIPWPEMRLHLSDAAPDADGRALAGLGRNLVL